jgi:hypothetical protein
MLSMIDDQNKDTSSSASMYVIDFDDEGIVVISS